MLKFAMPLYEAKYPEAKEWIEISDIEVMDELYKTHTKVTPAIKEMLRGKEVETPDGLFRLKLIGGVLDKNQSELAAA